MPMQPSVHKQLAAIPPESFKRRWAGFATAKLTFQLTNAATNPFFQFVQRLGEQESDWTFKAFLATADYDEADALTLDYPKRWHIEECFNANQALGWNLEPGWYSKPQYPLWSHDHGPYRPDGHPSASITTR